MYLETKEIFKSIIMKAKIITALFILLATSSAIYAQIPGFQLGIKGGANITKIGDQSFKDEFRFGYHFGGFAVIKLTNMIQIQPEVLYNQFNTKTSSDFDDVVNSDNLKDVKLNYLSIPLLLNITPSKLLTFQVGPQYGILINKNDDFFQNSKNAFKSGDFSMLGGIQLNIFRFKVSGRYMIGLSDIGDLPNKNEWKNQGFQLSVGMRII